MTNPKLSVVLPAHRYDEFLVAAIDSIIKQSHKDFELILILNGECSNYVDELKIKFKDPRIKYHSIGIPNLVFALNFGINAAKAEYIVRMDSDDVCKVNRLASLWGFIRRNPEVDVIASSFDIIDSSGSFVKQSTMKEMNNLKVRRLLPFRCIIPHPTVAFKKNAIIACGSYGYGQFSEDYDLWLRLLRSDKVIFHIIQESLIEYRVHNFQATNSINDIKIFAFDFSLKLREFIVTKRLAYLPGMLFTIIDLFYKRIRSIGHLFQ